MSRIWTDEELTRLESKVWSDIRWPVERAELGDLICSYRSLKARRSPSDEHATDL